MDYIKVDDNLIINLGCIYAIQRIPKMSKEYEDWNSEVEGRYTELMDNHPTLYVEGNRIDHQDDEYKYYARLAAEQEYEDSKPEKLTDYTYSVMLTTGVNVNIDKAIYDKIINNICLK